MQDDSLDDIREKVFSGYPFALSDEEKDILSKLIRKVFLLWLVNVGKN